MNENVGHEAAIPNPSLEPLTVLIGVWRTVGKHPMIEATTLHGRATFEWTAGGAFLVMHSEIDEPGVPSSISVIGRDDARDGYTMLYFDERGVSRIYEMTLSGNVWTYWRDAPGFRQRITGTIADDGNTILVVGELSRDDSTWERDLELTYTRVR